MNSIGAKYGVTRRQGIDHPLLTSYLAGGLRPVIGYTGCRHKEGGREVACCLIEDMSTAY
jgi:hypothetical protein